MASFDKVEHIFFDLDHTLWDFDRNSALAFEGIFKKNRVDVLLDDFLEVYVPINFDYWKLYRENRVTKEKLRYGRLKKSFDQLGISIDDHLIDRLSEDYIAYLPLNNHLFDGAVELLEYLKGRYKLHIITNGFQEVQAKKMKGSGIHSYFEAVVTSEAVGVKKPDAKIFHHALDLAKAKPKNSLMVGDSYEADILGAHGVGMKTVFFNHRKQLREDAFPQIEELLQLKELL